LDSGCDFESIDLVGFIKEIEDLQKENTVKLIDEQKTKRLLEKRKEKNSIWN